MSKPRVWRTCGIYEPSVCEDITYGRYGALEFGADSADEQSLTLIARQFSYCQYWRDTTWEWDILTLRCSNPFDLRRKTSNFRGYYFWDYSRPWDVIILQPLHCSAIFKHNFGYSQVLYYAMNINDDQWPSWPFVIFSFSLGSAIRRVWVATKGLFGHM